MAPSPPVRIPNLQCRVRARGVWRGREGAVDVGVERATVVEVAEEVAAQPREVQDDEEDHVDHRQDQDPPALQQVPAEPGVRGFRVNPKP